MTGFSKFKFLSVLIFSGLFCQASLAGFMLSPSLSYTERSVENNGTTNDLKMTIIDFRVGYTLDMGLYFGGLYSLQDDDLFGTDASDAYAGLSVGWDFGNLFLVGTYYLYGERDLGTGGIKYSAGTGYQIDVAYLVPITKMIFLGPQLSMMSVDFKDQQVNGTSTTADYKVSGITPGFNLTFKFE